MTNLAVFFVAVLALEGVFSDVTKYDDDFSFVEVWEEIEGEIRQVSLHLMISDREEEAYAKTVIEQCGKLAALIGDVIKQLKEETIGHEVGDIIFKRVMYVFQEVYNSLNRIVALKGGVELNSGLIYNLEVTSERMEQLVYIGKTYCPQLRAVLRTLLVDFLRCVQEFPISTGILEQNVIIYESPRRMVSQCKVLTEEFTDLLKEFSHMDQIRMLFRGFARYVDEILQKLDVVTIPDVEVKNVTLNLREMQSLLTGVTTREVTNVRSFQTDIFYQLCNVNEAFERLVILVDRDDYSSDLKSSLEKIIYYYYYAVKQTHFEVRTAYKNAFYGLSGNWELSSADSPDSVSFEIETPKEIVMKIQKLLKDGILLKPTPDYYYSRLLEMLELVTGKIDSEVKTGYLLRTEMALNTFSQYLKVIKREIEANPNGDGKYQFEEIVEMAIGELYKLVIAEKMQDNGFEHLLMKEICEQFLLFLRGIGSPNLISPTEVVAEIRKLTTKSFASIHDPQVVTYCFRELGKVLEYVIDKLDKEVKIGHLPNSEVSIRTFSQYLKVVKAALNSEDYPKYEFSAVAQMVSMKLDEIVSDRRIPAQGFENLVLKDICLEFLTFFRNIYYKIEVYREEFS
ncbi:hypothetical protein RI129_012283 [Pyrocoelia pectoralis]|uniref:Uncharacterized protein n=1 Tax=Pyrocoelia pectoralis TaxID=417401 RepID=A0AAN7ZFS1_9COLE